MEAINENATTNFVDVATENNELTNEKTSQQEKTIDVKFTKVLEIVLYILGFIFLFFGFQYYFQDLDYHSNPLNFYEERYVGGDAYNYIISAARSSAVMIKSLIWIILGCSSLIIGRTFRKE